MSADEWWRDWVAWVALAWAIGCMVVWIVR